MLPLFSGSPAWAGGSETVSNSLRTDEEFAPKPLVFHGFEYFPSLGLLGKYNSNLFATKTDAQSDYIVATRPSILIHKNYKGLDFSVNGEANIERFVESRVDNKEEFKGGLNGVYEMNSRWALPFGINYEKNYRERGTPQSQNSTAAPIAIQTSDAYFGIKRTFNRLSAEVRGTASKVTFADGVSVQDNNTPIIFSDSNRRSFLGSLTLRYNIFRSSSQTPELSFFTTLASGKQKYDKLSYSGGSFSGPSKDRTTRSFLTGVDLAYKGLIFGTIGVGYGEQKLDEGDEKLNSSKAVVDFGFKVTPKWVVGPRIYREINVDDIVETNYALSSAYEIHHNLYLHNSLLYDTYDFSEIDRNDKDYGAEAELRYYLGQDWSAGISASYKQRKSSNEAIDFDRYLIGLRLTGRL